MTTDAGVGGMTTGAGGPAPAAAAEVFGSNVGLARRYVDLLADAGVQRGLIGPREAGRLWDRHVLNCAVIGELIRPGSAVLDVGSGAGLPGVPLALARPDLSVTLLEPMARRIAFLHEVIGELGLQNVTVVRGRAEDTAVRRSLRRSDVVTARAVASLERLLGWCRPLMAPAGELLAIRGASARAELDEAQLAVRAAGMQATVESCGAAVLATPTTVVRAVSAAGARRQRPG